MNPHEEAARHDKAARIVVEVLRRATEQHVDTSSADLIWFYDGLRDGEWFLIWRGARCVQAPSAECKRIVRGLLIKRLPLDELLKLAPTQGALIVDEAYVFTSEDRELCRQLENDRALRSYDDAKMRGEP